MHHHVSFSHFAWRILFSWHQALPSHYTSRVWQHCAMAIFSMVLGTGWSTDFCAPKQYRLWMNEFHEEISCKHPLQGSAQGLGKLKRVLHWMTGNFCCCMAKLTHEDIHIPVGVSTQLQPRVLVVTRMFLVVEVLFNLEVSFKVHTKKENPTVLLLLLHMLEVWCVHGDYYVDALQVYLAFRAAALNLYATLPLW